MLQQDKTIVKAGSEITHADGNSDDALPDQIQLPPDQRSNFLTGLSVKLLFLTVAFVMIAEVLIFLPSIANFRNVWLQTRLATAEAASIVFLDSSDVMLSEEAGQNLLEITESLAIAIRQEGASKLVAYSDIPRSMAEHIDLDNVTAFSSIQSALGMLFRDPNEQYRVFGTARSSNSVMELVQEMRHIQRAMWIYARNVMVLSIIISVFTASAGLFSTISFDSAPYYSDFK